MEGVRKQKRKFQKSKTKKECHSMVDQI